VIGVILMNTPLRAIEISRTGCLLESSRRIEAGTTGELRLKIDRRTYTEIVKVTRCQRLEGAAASYRLGVEFLSTRRLSSSSLRYAVNSLLESKRSGMNSQREQQMKTAFGKFVREEDGQDLIEYALLAAFVALAAIGAMIAVGGGINTLFTTVKTKLEEASK
jgi:pilus assembly protein Flp/PilA